MNFFKEISAFVCQRLYHSPGWNKDYPKFQIITVEEILAGKTVNLPPNIRTFKKAEKVIHGTTDQVSLFGGKNEV
jgi:hypothetical protein